MSTDVLPGMPKPPSAPETAKASAGRRLTERQTADIQAGHHPLTGGPLHPQADLTAGCDPRGLSCGTCAHRVLMQSAESGKSWPKCDVSKMTHGAATDVRRWWPACTRWEAT